MLVDSQMFAEPVIGYVNVIAVLPVLNITARGESSCRWDGAVLRPFQLDGEPGASLSQVSQATGRIAPGVFSPSAVP